MQPLRRWKSSRWHREADTQTRREEEEEGAPLADEGVRDLAASHHCSYVFKRVHGKHVRSRLPECCVPFSTLVLLNRECSLTGQHHSFHSQSKGKHIYKMKSYSVQRSIIGSKPFLKIWLQCNMIHFIKVDLWLDVMQENTMYNKVAMQHNLNYRKWPKNKRQPNWTLLIVPGQRSVVSKTKPQSKRISSNQVRLHQITHIYILVHWEVWLIIVIHQIPFDVYFYTTAQRVASEALPKFPLKKIKTF